jgi:septal ring factor EnvC (AmiA/AmiB activator)
LVEDRIAAAGAVAADGCERTHPGSLESRRGVIAEVLTALQRMGRRPPPAILVRPEDALESLRAAMLLGAVLPDMRSQAEALATDLTNLVRLRADIGAERAKLTTDLAALTEERPHGRPHRRASEAAGGGRDALDTERQRASQLGRQIDNLGDLISKRGMAARASCATAGDDQG